MVTRHDSIVVNTRVSAGHVTVNASSSMISTEVRQVPAFPLQSVATHKALCIPTGSNVSMVSVESRTIVSPSLMINWMVIFSGKQTSSNAGLVSVTKALQLAVSGSTEMTPGQSTKKGPTVSFTLNEMASTITLSQASYATRSAITAISVPHINMIESGTGVPGHVEVSSKT